MWRLRRSGKSYFSRIHRFQHTSYADIEVRENGYEGMPPVQEMIASLSRCGRDILSQGSLLAILAPESCLNGRAYAAAGQIVASLHTMAVLQAYQTDLLKDLDKAFYKVQV